MCKNRQLSYLYHLKYQNNQSWVVTHISTHLKIKYFHVKVFVLALICCKLSCFYLIIDVHMDQFYNKRAMLSTILCLINLFRYWYRSTNRWARFLCVFQLGELALLPGELVLLPGEQAQVPGELDLLPGELAFSCNYPSFTWPLSIIYSMILNSRL